jgi:D-alanyl-D-alanine carboxypeptidase (penicillin-binding protein 5/6)
MYISQADYAILLNMSSNHFCRKAALLLLAVLYLVFPLNALAFESGLVSDPQSFEDSPDDPAETLKLVQANSYLLLDVTTGNAILSENTQQEVSIASTTKMMTALVLVEQVSDLSAMVTCGNEVYVSDPASSLAGLVKGQTLSYKDLLYGLMLPSGNDAAQVIAVAVSGSIPAFVERMNQRAKELGMTHTQFENPHGLYGANHYSTAEDLAILAQAVLDNPTLLEVVSTREYTLPANWKYPQGRKVYNFNPLLHETTMGNSPQGDPTPNPYYVEGTQGIKTGFINEAGYCLVAAATQEGRTLIAVVLGSETPQLRSQSTAALLRYGFDHTSIVEITPTLREIPLKLEAKNTGILGRELPVVLDITEERSFPLLMTNSDRDRFLARDGITVNLIPNAELQAPIQQNQTVGQAEVYFDGALLFSCDIRSAQYQPNRYHLIVYTALAIFCLLLISRVFLYWKQHRKKEQTVQGE